MAVRSLIYDRNDRLVSETFRLVLFDPKIRHLTDKTTFSKILKFSDSEHGIGGSDVGDIIKLVTL